MVSRLWWQRPRIEGAAPNLSSKAPGVGASNIVVNFQGRNEGFGPVIPRLASLRNSDVIRACRGRACSQAYDATPKDES